MTDLNAQIREALEEAARLDELARDRRRIAGFLLAQARSADPQGSRWHTAAGLDQRTAELLLEMASGGYEATEERSA